MSSFPPIDAYGFVSDCVVNALISPSGRVEWLCLPRPDSPTVFGALLDRSAGVFQFGPSNTRFPEQRSYVPGTMVLETTWHTPNGWLVVSDMLVVGPWDGIERPDYYKRSPGDHTAWGVLLRHATCIGGRVELQLNTLPVLDYGTKPLRWRYEGEGFGRAVGSAEDSEIDLRVCTSLRVGFAGTRLYGRTILEEGQSGFVALSWKGLCPEDLAEAEKQMATTVDFWRGWLSVAKLPDHPWRPYIERSALTLKGLSYSPTGAILAAATTSLPETVGGERNWDYRYTWVRDSAFMLRSLLQLGFDWEAFEYFAFLLEAMAADTDHIRHDLQVMYGVGGELQLDESTLDHLSGYAGSRPVRVGNAAYNQRQHDVWGMLLDSVQTHVLEQAAHMVNPIWEGVAQLVENAVEHWREPDRGIWEVRGEPKHFVSSKVMCWVAVDRGARLALERDDTERAKRWRTAADEIMEDVCANGIDSRGVFVAHYGTDALDASALLIPIMGFLPPDDDHVRKTVLTIADELTKDGLVLRYEVAHTDDGLAGEEGTFTICSFWLVSALAMIGETERARELCEKLLSLASPLLLYAEEIDARSGQHLGNFPQAFTHLALIDALGRLIEAQAGEHLE